MEQFRLQEKEERGQIDGVIIRRRVELKGCAN